METQHQQRNVDDLSVVILPVKPTAKTTLHAVSKSSGNDPISYTWEINNNGLENEKGPSLEPRGRFAKGDRVSVIIKIGNSTAHATSVIENTPPEVIAVVLKPEYIFQGTDITAEPTSRDIDGDTVQCEIQWSINDTELSERGLLLSGEKIKRGDRISFKVVPFDGESAGSSFISMPVVIPNAPPLFISSPPREFKGEAFSYQAKAEDADGDSLIYNLISGPEGMQIDQHSGLVSMSIKKEHTGTHQVEIGVQDSLGVKAYQRFTLVLTSE